MTDVHSEAQTVQGYLDSLAEPRRTQILRTLDIVRPALPDGLSESMDYGMITWAVPLQTVADTYNGKPLMFGALASQKNYVSLYLMTLYAGVPLSEQEFRARWAGPKTLRMGRSCVRYASVDELDVPLIVDALGTPVAAFVQAYNETRVQRRST